MKWKLLLAALLFVALCFLAWRLFSPMDQETTDEAITQEELDKGIKEKITIDARKKTITRSRVAVRKEVSGGRTPVKSVGGNETSPNGEVIETKKEHFERRAVITQDDEGRIRVYAPKSGAILEAGLLLGWRQGDMVLGFDGQLFYYKQWGLNVGANALLRGSMQPRAHIAVSYAIPVAALSNTSVFLGIDTSKEVITGIRVRL